MNWIEYIIENLRFTEAYTSSNSNDEETNEEKDPFVKDVGDFEGIDSDTETMLLEIDMFFGFFLKYFKVVCTFSSTQRKSALKKVVVYKKKKNTTKKQFASYCIS